MTSANIRPFANRSALASRAQRRRAFTLLELLVVFTIIAILVGLALMVGQKVLGSSKIKSTRNVLQALDQAVDAYNAAKGGTAAKFPDRFVDADKNEFPLSDAALTPPGTLLPSGELAVELLLNEPASAAILKGIPSEFINKPTAVAISGVQPKRSAPGNTSVVITYTQIKDAWGKPIRFVHPAYQGVYGNAANPTRSTSIRRGATLVPIQLSRTWSLFNGIGDGGLCTGGRPYFYSVGPDGNPSTIEDNVYSIQPTFDAVVKAAGQ